MVKYEFDKDSFDIKRASRSVSNIIMLAVKWIVGTASLAALYYLIASFFISTEAERRLRTENKMYEKLYERMEERQDLIGDVIEDLRVRDDGIYEKVFHTDAPSVEAEIFLRQSLYKEGSDGAGIVKYTEQKINKLDKTAAGVEENLKSVLDAVILKKKVLPPMGVPVDDLVYAKIGASVGQKINPFYKVPSQHNGLDIIAAQGDAVYAAANGFVSEVKHSGKGLGNMVEIKHEGGYYTRYAHLGNISVAGGQSIKKGQKIGSVGMSGGSFVPHLHYEVFKDGKFLDPINHLFSDLSPKDYANMTYMAIRTQQSLD